MHDLHPAARQLAILVERVTDTQLDAPTPCPGYAVADLLDHIARLTVAFAEAGRKERGTNAEPPPERRHNTTSSGPADLTSQRIS